MKQVNLTVENLEDKRIDKYLVFHLKDEYNFSRSHIQKLIETKLVKVNQQLVTSNYHLKLNDQITVELMQHAIPIDLVPVKMDLPIIYEDNDIVVINKPNNMVVHPAFGHENDTLVNGLLEQISDLSSINGTIRPGIVHRIDKNTTGLLVVAKNDQAHQQLSLQLKNKTMYREYLAIVRGVIKENKGKIDAPIGRDQTDRKKMSVNSKNGKNAITNFEVIKRFFHFTYIKCIIETGRTHQIRVHLKYIKHPILGDNVYAHRTDKNDEFGQYLHAAKLVLNHPVSGKKLEFNCDLSSEFKSKLEQLNNEEVN